MWAVEHATAFGFGPDQTKTVLAWGPVFSRLFRRDELNDATGVLLANPDAPKFAGDHRGAVIRAVESVRKRTTAKESSAVMATGCRDCGGCGLVIVPHPGMADDADQPRWRHILLLPSQDPRGLTRTTAVACVMCETGRRARDESEKHDRPLMTISQYEALYPYWKQVRDERLKVLNAGRPEPTPDDVSRLNKLIDTYRRAAAERAG